MIKLGDYNTLRIVRFTDHGAYLDGGATLGEILMPKAYVKREMRPGDEVTVFVYLDQSERLVGTLETPLARVGDFAYLQVAWVNEFGAFLDWGLMKDLFVPFREQKMPMVQGRGYLVHIHIDPETRRIVASAKVERYLRSASPSAFHRGQEVEGLIQQKTPLGFKVIVNNRYAGMIYDNQIFTRETPHTGDRLTATVVTVRPDGRLDLSLGAIGKTRFRDFADELRSALQEAPDGQLPFTDHSSPEEIQARFGVSKKTFKRALGTLYRNKEVLLGESHISLKTEKKKQKK